MYQAKPAVNTLVGIVANRAGIVKHKVCRLVIDHLKTNVFKDAYQFLAVLCVHLTTKSLPIRGQAPAKLLALGIYNFPRFFIK